MVIFIVCLLCIILFLLIGRYIYRCFKTYQLYKSFAFPHQKIKEELTHEYLYKLKKQDIDQVVYNDLELDKLFQIVNRTYSDVGKEYMHAQMFTSHNHQQLEDIIEKLKDAKRLKRVIYELYVLSKGYSSALHFFDQENVLSRKDTFVVLTSTLILLTLIISCFFMPIMIMVVFFWIGIQNFLYSYYTKKTDDMMSQCMSYSYVIECLNHLAKLDIFSFEDYQKIQRMIKVAHHYTLVSRIIALIEVIDIFYLMEFVKGIFFIPIYQCYFLLKHKEELALDFLTMYEYVGMIEAAVSIISLRHEYEVCIPTLSSKPIVKFKECYHPLINNPVKNSFESVDSCLITGSNASGKSTFLKTVGINMIMAKAYHTCFADEFVYYPFQLCTSIHIQDDIQAGESYYIREIKTLKKILDDISIKECLVLIDEILRGTNEKERIAISKVVLRYLFDSQSLVFVTTHDLSLVDAFLDIHKYCFHDQVVGESWQSDYIIKEGVCKVGNAIKLLNVFGFDQEICEQLKKPF